MFKPNSRVLRALALTVFTSGLTFSLPVMAAPMDDSDNSQITDQDHAASQMQPMHKMHGREEVEARIQTLHDKLKITSAQESDWDKVAETMRDNEANIHELIKSRHQNAESMTAVDDLQSYQKIAQAHADGLQKMTDSFQTLYNHMSDAQKKNADEVFGKFEGHRGNKNAMKKNS